jgi:hypothetical protein
MLNCTVLLHAVGVDCGAMSLFLEIFTLRPTGDFGAGIRGGKCSLSSVLEARLGDDPK